MKKYILLISLFLLPSPVLAESVDLRNNFGFAGPEFSNLGLVITLFLPIFFGVSALLLFFYFLWASFRLLKSGGNKEEIAKARAMITNSIVGFLILMVAVLALQVLPKMLGLNGYQIIK